MERLNIIKRICEERPLEADFGGTVISGYEVGALRLYEVSSAEAIEAYDSSSFCEKIRRDEKRKTAH